MAQEPNDEVYVPGDVTKAAEMALELHAQLYPETPPAEPGQEEPPAEPPAPASEPEPAPAPDEELTYKQRYEVLQGKYSKEVPRMANDIRELKQHLATLQAAPPATPAAPEISEADEIIAQLKEEYPEELIDRLLKLQRIQSEQVVSERVKPIQEKAISDEATQEAARQEQHLALLTGKAPHWEKIWDVVSELEAGVPPSDDKIAAFLQQPDPSGLYTNMELLNAYNEKWDADRFATLCNMYSAPAPAAPPPQNPGKDALLAPARAPSNPSPQVNDKKVWTMAEIEQFQRDRRADKVSETDAAAIWLDIQQALAENRIR